MIFHPCLSFPPPPPPLRLPERFAGRRGWLGWPTRKINLLGKHLSRLYSVFVGERKVAERKEGRKEGEDGRGCIAVEGEGSEGERNAGWNFLREEEEKAGHRSARIFLDKIFFLPRAVAFAQRAVPVTGEELSFEGERTREFILFDTLFFFFFFFHFCYSLVLFDRGDEINISPQYRIVEASRTIFNENF